MKKYSAIVFRMLSSLALMAAYFFAAPNATTMAAEKDFAVFNSGLVEWSPSVAYNYMDDVFLVVTTVWDTLNDTGDDIYGQFVNPDGSLRGNRFPICLQDSAQYDPDVAYGRNNEFMVVWYDYRMGNSDIFGARLDASGKKLKNAKTLADTTFAICDQDSGQYSPRIAYNFMDNNYLVVFEDYRNAFIQQLPITKSKRIGKAAGGFWMVNCDVYGQRLNELGIPIAPGDPPGTKTNFPVAVNAQYDEYYPDVAYCGGDSRPDEWLVVFTREKYTYDEPTLIWGTRVNGKDGALLDTWGNPFTVVMVKAAGVSREGPPWAPYFPIGRADTSDPTSSSVYQGSPHVESNVNMPVQIRKAASSRSYPVPECLIAWTEYPPPAQMKTQRVAYFPDSTAYRRKLKSSPGGDGQFTLVPVDSMGKPADPPSAWITWKNINITRDDFAHVYGHLSYNSNVGDYLVVWNDWRKSGWNGTYSTYPFTVPEADIYGQRLYLSPWDSSIVFLDENSSVMSDPYANIPIVNTSADEGDLSYPGIAYGWGHSFLIAYEYDKFANDSIVDIHGAMFKSSPTAVRDRRAGNTPNGFLLARNYPNPFNPGTTIEFRLPSTGRTTIKICDMLGREIVGLMDQNLEPGQQTVRWDGRDALGNPAVSGMYFYRIQSGPYSVTGKMLLIK
jgi:hypothetical protein